MIRKSVPSGHRSVRGGISAVAREPIRTIATSHFPRRDIPASIAMRRVGIVIVILSVQRLSGAVQAVHPLFHIIQHSIRTIVDTQWQTF